MNDDLDKLKQDVIAELSKASPKQKQDFYKNLVGAPVPGTRTYYAHKYAIELIVDLKEMSQKEIVLVYPYSDFKQWRHHTLWCYVSESFRYAVDYMDDATGWLRALRDKVKVMKHSDAVRIIYKTEGKAELRARKVSYDDPMARDPGARFNAPEPEGGLKDSWRQDLMEWIESSKSGSKSGDMFERAVELEQLDVEYLHALCDDEDSMFGLSVKPDRKSFKILRGA